MRVRMVVRAEAIVILRVYVCTGTCKCMVVDAAVYASLAVVVISVYDDNAAAVE
jgi:hypothetical protein